MNHQLMNKIKKFFPFVHRGSFQSVEHFSNLHNRAYNGPKLLSSRMNLLKDDHWWDEEREYFIAYCTLLNSSNLISIILFKKEGEEGG